MARRLTKEQVISKIYYNNETGFGSIQETFKKPKAENPDITITDVREFMRKQPNKQIKGYRGTTSFTAPFARFEYQIDIMYMTPWASKPKPEVKISVEKGTPKQALVVIDIFSKYADVKPMEHNDSKEVLKALKEAFKKVGYPMSIYSDNDGAFQLVVGQFFKDEGIEHIVTQTHANAAERFIRTIKGMIHDRVRFNKASWTSMLTPALNKYNTTVHSSTKMTPKQAHKDDNNSTVRVNLTLRENNKRKYPEIKEGDMAKYFHKKRGNYTDRKEYNSKWSQRSYKVKEIKRDVMGNRTYRLEGIERQFDKLYLRHELLLAWTRT